MTNELTQAKKLIDLILARGDSVSISYGEDENELTCSTDRTALYAALHACDEEWITAQSPTGARLCTFFLVWGNAEDGSELICDHHANPYGEAIWKAWEI
jgi:hypothetical protein